MKILKIELQNINSLKSDSPCVINFEDDRFKDVGLFAITGSTGAGKTTILDAITIALYHNVPRFNNSKGVLRDVVSHGADHAFSRVSFENENIIYEASWQIRVAHPNTGRTYANPQEEVSFKNLTTNTILSSQKRAVILDVIKATQLDYGQFLRSVMLAQGEFASFLSAKGPEKGKLLEQITGEEVYKKIGQGILERKAAEEGKLKDIQAKINADDVLSEEQKNELTQKNNELDKQFKASEIELKKTETIVEWFAKSKVLDKQSEKLEADSKTISIHLENHKQEFELLDLNEKAEPFKDLLVDLKRTEKVSLEKQNLLKIVTNELVGLKPKIENLESVTKKQAVELEIANKTVTDWQPKFDKITQLDSELKSKLEDKIKSEKKLTALNEEIKLTQDQNTKFTKALAKVELEIKDKEAYVVAHKYLLDVDREVSNWASGLSTLKGHKTTLDKDIYIVSEKKKDVNNSTLLLKENKESLSKKLDELNKIEDEIKLTKELLSKNNITDLLAKQKALTTVEFNWKQLKTYAEDTTKETKVINTISIQKDSFSSELKAVNSEIERINKSILTQEISVKDAEQILELEKSIAKYETDRKHLIEGEPCGLCGSKTHPFTENLERKGITASELECNTRRDVLKKLNEKKAELDKKEVKLTISIQNINKQIRDINEVLNAIALKAEQLELACQLTDLPKIDIELNIVSTTLKAIDEKISNAQKLQATLDVLSTNYKDKNKSYNDVKTAEATLSEKIKNLNIEVEEKQKTIISLTKTCSDLELKLTSDFSKFNYKLPLLEHSNSFIEGLKKEISDFNSIQKNLESLKSEITVINTKLKNNTEKLATFSKSLEEYTLIINESKAHSVKLKTERIAILPIEISVEQKRVELNTISKKIADTLEVSKKNLQLLLDSKTTKETLHANYLKDLEALNIEIKTYQSTLEFKLKDSHFTTREAIEKALLNADDKQKYSLFKQRLKDNQLKLKTLQDALLKDQEKLQASKDFEISEAECTLALTDLKSRRDNFLSEKGQIKETFINDQKVKDRNQDIYKKIHAQEEICGIWKDLFKIIGNSKDAFNVYVQRLTLKHLLDLANVHLYKLNKRYSLKMEDSYKPKEELSFNLIDHYQTDQVRLVDTSSGGEKFIISLALALGLSDLASKNVKIDSLFIDEGFGTLDKNTLETVISTLETLQSQDKMIGIISHVENLKERIPTQIQITKKSNGVSEVNLV